ncbi:MAG: hypothetical protein JXQ23_11355 [Clostridia bacterium]|nr:hypothetical protein [Clostridia bacterium]
MKKFIIVLLSLTLIMLIAGCTKKTNIVEDTRFEVYISSIDDLVNGEYVMEELPLFTNSDLMSVNWEKQEYLFTKEFLKKLPASDTQKKTYIGGSILLGTKARDKFSVYVDGQFIYEGEFEQSVFSSYLPTGAILKDIENGVSIIFTDIKNSDLIDMRFDNSIKKALTELGLIN